MSWWSDRMRDLREASEAARQRLHRVEEKVEQVAHDMQQAVVETPKVLADAYAQAPALAERFAPKADGLEKVNAGLTRVADAINRTGPAQVIVHAMRDEKAAAQPPSPKPPNVAADAAHGIQLEPWATHAPPADYTAAEFNVKVGNYVLAPQMRGKQGSGELLYYNAYNKDSKRVEWIVGPDKVEDFKVANRALENQAAVYLHGNREYRPYEVKAAQTMQHLMDGDGKALATLGDANVEAVKDPHFWGEVALNMALAVAGSAEPKPKAAVTKPAASAFPTVKGTPRYQPSVTWDPALPAGEGRTTKYGDILVSPHGTPKDRALALAHEEVHSKLSPKAMNALRELRADIAEQTYTHVGTLRALEEGLAETVAQVKVNGLSVRSVLDGITFPVRQGYVSLGVLAGEAGVGAAGVITVGGYVYSLKWVSEKVQDLRHHCQEESAR